MFERLTYVARASKSVDVACNSRVITICASAGEQRIVIMYVWCLGSVQECLIVRQMPHSRVLQRMSLYGAVTQRVASDFVCLGFCPRSWSPTDLARDVF